MTIGSFTLREPLGIAWNLQYISQSVSVKPDCDVSKLSLWEDGCFVEADFTKINNGQLQIGLFTDLKPRQTRTFTVIETENNTLQSGFIQIRKTSNAIQLTAGALLFTVPADGRYQAGEVPPPLTMLQGGEIKAEGALTCACGALLHTEIHVFPLHAEINLHYDFDNGDRYAVSITINKNKSEIVLSEQFSMTQNAVFTLSCPGFKPDFAYARMHTPPKEKGSTDEWKRICYRVPKSEDAVRLQPFYCWDANSATLMQLKSENGTLCVVPLCPSAWENGREIVLTIITDKNVTIKAPLGKGRRKWLVSLPDLSVQAEGQGIALTSPYQNWNNMIQNPMTNIRYADSLCAVYGGPNLQNVLDWNLEAFTGEQNHPTLLIKAEEVQPFRKRVGDWDWLKKTLAAHKGDTQGFDPAGVYLATGEEQYAEIARGYIIEWLQSRLRMMTRMGYSLHEVVCIRLSRPLRLVALDYDLVSSSPCFSADDHRWILSVFAFLGQCAANPDYWPNKSIGFSKGNHNFHSDRFSALGTLGCLLKGYPAAREWIAYVQTEIEKELDMAVLPGGAWIEAPNYQAYSMNYLILLFAVLKNCGYKDFFHHSKWLDTMDFLASIQTIKDIRNGIAMLPTLGDTAANYWSQSFQNVFAWAAKMTPENPGFSKRMMRAWQQAGSPVINAGGELNSTFKTIALIDRSLPAAENPMPISRRFPEFGAVMRSPQGYLSLKCGSAGMHYDHDEGSLLWYEKGVPILADIGSQYCPSCDAAFMHNRISVAHQTDECRGRVTRFTTNPQEDSAEIEVIIDRIQEWTEWPVRDPNWNFRYQPPPHDIFPHKWNRSLVYDKEDGVLLIRDRVQGDLPWDQNFLLFAETVHVCKDHLEFTGQFGVNIAVWTFGSMDSQTYDWSYDGLDEPLFHKAFGMDWHDYQWMWEGKMTAMGEKIKLLRHIAAPNTALMTFLVPFIGGTPGEVRPLPDFSGIEWSHNNIVKKLIFDDGSLNRTAGEPYGD